MYAINGGHCCHIGDPFSFFFGWALLSCFHITAILIVLNGMMFVHECYWYLWLYPAVALLILSLRSRRNTQSAFKISCFALLILLVRSRRNGPERAERAAAKAAADTRWACLLFGFGVNPSYGLLSGPSPAWCLVFFMFPPACYAPVRCRKLGAEVRSSCTLQHGVIPIGSSVPPLECETSSICECASRLAFLLLIVAPTWLIPSAGIWYQVLAILTGV